MMTDRDLESDLFQHERHGWSRVTVKTEKLREILDRLAKAEARLAKAEDRLVKLDLDWQRAVRGLDWMD